MKLLRFASRFAWAIVILGCVNVAMATQCDTLPARRSVDFDSMAVFQFEFGGASCWGWEAPNGRHYAIMGGRRSIGFIDVQTMTVIDTVPTHNCQWRELKTYRNYCYVVSECLGDKQGMMIIDMKYLPDSVHYVGSYSTPSNIRSHCISIDTARGYCYLVRQNYSGFRILSLANPEAPVDVGGVSTGDLHDMTAFNDTVYAAEGYNSSFSIWNCANKSSPVLLARVAIPGDGYVHNVWPTDDRRFLASTEEIPVGRTLKVWNIEDLSSISMVSQYIGPGQIPHNAHVEGNYLFVAHYTSGVSILDFEYPECPVVIKEFDTYTTNNNPSYDGCWGVYPHTNGSGWVYASNIDGRLFVFKFTSHPFAASAQFNASPRVGNVPFDVNFSSTGDDLIEWNWDFGDGGQSSAQNPTHTYTQPGLYDVSLAVGGLDGADTLLKPIYVVALAETLLVSDTGFNRGTQVVWDVNLSNTVPVEEIRLPVRLTGIPANATFDSLTFSGCRTEYFELKQTVYSALAIGEIVVLMRPRVNGNVPDLAPGDGPIAKIHLTIRPNATPGNVIVLSTPQLGFHPFVAKTAGLSYTPASPGAAAIITSSCDCTCHGDANCDGSLDIQDVVNTIDVAFRGATPTADATCPHSSRTDVNCSGATDVLDIILTIDATFRGEDASATFCDPCD